MNSINPLHLPYGAFELKAAYQRNMLIGMLLTTSVVVLLVAASWLLGGEKELPPLVPPEPPVGGEFVIPNPESFVVIRAALDPAFAVTNRPGTPVPVDDDEIGDLDMVIPSSDEMAVILDGQYGDAADAGAFSTGNSDAPAEYIPTTTEFVPVDIFPELVHYVEPEYPRFAKDAGLEGVVHIKALVMPDGSVKEAMVLKSSEVNSLDEAALRAATKSVYKPAVRNGYPVAIWVTYRVEFVLTR